MSSVAPADLPVSRDKGSLEAAEEAEYAQPTKTGRVKRRLTSRGTESEDSLNARINKAAYELSFKHSFDQVIVNAQLDQACAEAEAAIFAFLQG